MSENVTQTLKISIIIPVYNAERFLRQCLDSVITQPMKELDIICVDDGSTDKSPQILEEYANRDSRIRVIHQPNLHAGIARNKGIEAATGEYIHFLDADDYLTDNAYEKAYKLAHESKIDYLKVKAHPVDASTGDMIKGLMAERYALDMLNPLGYDNVFSFADHPEILTTTPVYAPWSGLYRRKFIVENNIRFESLWAINDHSFYYAVIARARRIMVADFFVLYYRMNNAGSLVGNIAKRFVCNFDSFRIISEECSFLPKRLYELILNTELACMFNEYNNVIAKGALTKQMQLLIRDFVCALDFSLVADVSEGASWFPDYLMLKHEVAVSDGALNVTEERELATALEEALRKAIPSSLENVRKNCRTVLYGAGANGRRLRKLIQLTGLCEIVLWVDKSWEALNELNLPISSPDNILDVQFDTVLITVLDPLIASEIKGWLVEKGIPGDAVITISDSCLQGGQYGTTIE